MDYRKLNEKPALVAQSLSEESELLIENVGDVMREAVDKVRAEMNNNISELFAELLELRKRVTALESRKR